MSLDDQIDNAWVVIAKQCEKLVDRHLARIYSIFRPERRASTRVLPSGRSANRVLPICQSSRAALAFSLNWWAFHRAVAAEHAAIACLWLKQGLAGSALVKPLTSVRWHVLFPACAADRAGDGALQDHTTHRGHFFTVVGNPIAEMALANCSGCVLSGSNLTCALCDL